MPSANRARGGDNMTSEELDSIQEANTIEADFIDGADVMVDGFETAASTSVDMAAEAGSVLDVAGDILSDMVAPALGAYVAGTEVAKHMDNDQDKLGYGALAAGGAALLCATPVGATALGFYCGAKLFIRVWDWCGLNDTTPVC